MNAPLAFHTTLHTTLLYKVEPLVSAAHAMWLPAMVLVDAVLCLLMNDHAVGDQTTADGWLACSVYPW